MRNSVSKAQYLLFGLLFALTACGTTTTQTSGTGSGTASGKITANLVLPAQKTVGLQADVTKINLKVTGATIPTASKDFANNTGGSLEVYPGSNLIVTAQAYAGSSVMYEGFATNVTVAPSGTTNVTIQLNAPVVKAENAPCLGCHDNTRDVNGQNLVANYKQSGHYTNTAVVAAFAKNGAILAGCAGCHGTQHNDLSPSDSGRCYECHSVSGINSKHDTANVALQTACVTCHQPHNTELSCIGCHDVAQNAIPFGINAVNDNNGVRAITDEFSKWSHHVTGRSVTDADCAVCHLEGKKSGTDITVDSAYHMKDNKTYLRNCNTSLAGNQSKSVGGAYPWDPAAPDHTLMDQFCFSCHNAEGAPTALAALAGVAQADSSFPRTALNPFGDTMSNQYDLLSRPAVVNAYDQFDTGNSSHHAVRGSRYTATTLSTAIQGQISSVNAAAYTNWAGSGGAKAGQGYVGLKNTPNLKVGTIYSAGYFSTLYTPLGTSATLTDNSTLHCGDCHTVGQYKPNSTVNVNGVAIANVIGAHGSNNEYLLRKPDGSESNAASAKDALVCYLCHAQSQYGAGNWASGGYPGEGGHAGIVTGTVGTTQRECNTDGNNAAGQVGLARITSESPATSFADPVVMAKLVAGKYAGNGGGNILGNKCLNCHNASDKKTFGGIHGNAFNASYTTYSAANTWTALVAGNPATGNGSPGATFTATSKKPYRFLPGLGNFRYNGGQNTDQWTQRSFQSGKGVKQGCYTLNGASSKRVSGANPSGTGGYGVDYFASPFPTKAKLSGTNVSQNAIADDNGILGSWGACSDHAGSSVTGVSETVDRTILRPLTY